MYCLQETKIYVKDKNTEKHTMWTLIIRKLEKLYKF